MAVVFCNIGLPQYTTHLHTSTLNNSLQWPIFTAAKFSEHCVKKWSNYIYIVDTFSSFRRCATDKKQNYHYWLATLISAIPRAQGKNEVDRRVFWAPGSPFEPKQTQTAHHAIQTTMRLSALFCISVLRFSCGRTDTLTHPFQCWGSHEKERTHLHIHILVFYRYVHVCIYHFKGKS